MRAQPRKPRTTTEDSMESIEERKIAFGEVLKQARFFHDLAFRNEAPQLWRESRSTIARGHKKRRGLRIAPLLRFLVILIKKKQAACEYK